MTGVRPPHGDPQELVEEYDLEGDLQALMVSQQAPCDDDQPPQTPGLTDSDTTRSCDAALQAMNSSRDSSRPATAGVADHRAELFWAVSKSTLGSSLPSDRCFGGPAPAPGMGTHQAVSPTRESVASSRWTLRGSNASIQPNFTGAGATMAAASAAVVVFDPVLPAPAGARMSLRKVMPVGDFDGSRAGSLLSHNKVSPASSSLSLGQSMGQSLGQRRNSPAGLSHASSTDSVSTEAPRHYFKNGRRGSHSEGYLNEGYNLSAVQERPHKGLSSASFFNEHSAGLRRRVSQRCRALIKRKLFQANIFLTLIAALFLPDMWIVLDRPTNSDLDVLLTLALLIFIMDFVLQSFGTAKSYVGSFFFWMDLLGVASLLLDLTYLGFGLHLSMGESAGSNVVIVRAARVAKLGARAGRFTKLVKLLRFLPGMGEQVSDESDVSGQGTAKVISSRLTTALSVRISCLIIVTVMFVPLCSMWSYPVQDWSMESWLDILDATSLHHPEQFNAQLTEFSQFYANMNYYPYRLATRPGAVLNGTVLASLPWVSSRGSPKRGFNSVRQRSRFFEFEFNFKVPNQVNALVNVALLILVIFLMVAFSILLSNSVSAIVLRPLEKLQAQVKRMVSSIFQSVTHMATTMREDGEESSDDDSMEDGSSAAADFGRETRLLEKVVGKLGELNQLTMNRSAVLDEVMKGLGEGDRAVVCGFQGSRGSSTSTDTIEEYEEVLDHRMAIRAQKAMVESAGLSLDLLDSDNLNPLELDRARNHAAAVYFVGPHNHGVVIDPVTMGSFLEVMESSYIKTCPYHNWYHAVDVAHAVYRILRLCKAEAYLSSSERFGLLVSAVSHDVGHPGLNNIFLAETSHELALRYNDKSPLENMHCARLFEIASMPKCNIFARLPRQQFQEVRKVCVDSILHTDNAQHFAMVKEVQMFYQVQSEILDHSRDAFVEDAVLFPTEECTECFRLLESRKLLVKLILHFSDISNCMKPFRICQIWAWQVCEEMFMQGDAERRLNIQVQALNDRERVNRAFSQVGFIEFLVSPLAFTAVQVLSPIEHFTDQMVQNAETWHRLWLAETKPTPSEAEQKALAERISKLQAKQPTRHS